MTNNEIIHVGETRLLSPTDFDTILHEIDKPEQRRRFLILFWSGLRYAEFKRLHKHPEWYMRKRNTIFLGRFAAKKAKRSQLERYVHPLPDLMPELMAQFFNDPRPPTLQTWNENMNRWGMKAGFEQFEYIDDKGNKKLTYGLGAKTTRKTIESWMIISKVPENAVYLRQGHDKVTSLNHYQGLPFTDAERDEINNRLRWMPK